MVKPFGRRKNNWKQSQLNGECKYEINVSAGVLDFCMKDLLICLAIPIRLALIALILNASSFQGKDPGDSSELL